jgi:hypothetical protein
LDVQNSTFHRILTTMFRPALMNPGEKVGSGDHQINPNRLRKFPIGRPAPVAVGRGLSWPGLEELRR